VDVTFLLTGGLSDFWLQVEHTSAAVSPSLPSPRKHNMLHIHCVLRKSKVWWTPAGSRLRLVFSRLSGQSIWKDREVCCLPGARVMDVAKKLPSLVRPSDYYPLLVMQVGRDEITERSPKAIKRDFRALGQLFEGSGRRWCFPPSHQWQGTALKGAGELTWLTDGSGTGAIGQILASFITGRCTQHRACW